MWHCDCTIPVLCYTVLLTANLSWGLKFKCTKSKKWTYVNGTCLKSIKWWFSKAAAMSNGSRDSGA